MKEEIMKKLSIIFTALILTTIFVSCGGPDMGYTDGSYSAVYDAFDSHGWKPQMTMEVKNGKITSADFDYVNKSGQLKSEDQAYAERMTSITKKDVTPKEAGEEMAKQLKKAQVGPVDGISGATSSADDFNALAAALIKNAKAGKTAEVVLPMNDTYKVSDEADERGYTATIAVTYKDGKIASVEFDEENEEMVGKEGNEDYNSRMADKSGISWDEAQAQLIEQLKKTGNPEDVDTVTGATSLSERFKALAAVAVSQR